MQKDLRKNYFDGDSRNLKSYILDNTAWKARILMGILLQMVYMTMLLVTRQMFQGAKKNNIRPLRFKLILKTCHHKWLYSL